MASTELGLKRTLTDILEDELYHINNKNSGAYSSHYQYPISNKAYMASNGNNNNNNNSNNNTSSSNEETIVTIEPEKLNSGLESDNYITSVGNNSTTGITPKKEFTLQNYQQYDMSVFSRYADPSLTTTTKTGRKINNNNIQDNMPAPETINMNSVVSVPNPFINPRNITSIFDVKILDNSIESEELQDNYLYYDDNEDSIAPKIQYPLQDNNMALNNEDAKMIFDNEFSDEDNDFDDDSNEFDIADDEIISSLAIESNKNITARNNNIYRFVDNADGNTRLINDNDDNNIVLDDDSSDDEVEEDIINEDTLQYISILDGKKLVSDDEIKELKRSKSLSLKNRPNISSLANDNLRSATQTGSNKLRKPLTNINSNSNNIVIHNHNNTSNNTIKKTKKITKTSYSTHDSIDHELASSINNQGGNGSEIYTCRLINLITKEQCSAEFSRSYDLTRHQNTIHAKKKIIFRCSECIKLLGNEGYDKTFSRLDALTRHIKSKHEDLTKEERQRVTKYAKENIGYAAA